MSNVTRIAIGAMCLAIFTGGAAGAQADEWEGDHTPITAQQCVDGGGEVKGAICERGYYTGWIVL
ncbi:hypothetical protein [Nocardia sp. XZ_19_385]|uniref:hypothetical protein n=1 Tax=Nocardia sp. XZ_19_385 TaxID=2769488 RepID=UPI00188E1EFE|nr:hypothetical protein [Nocardia sp. XZ_19_385]